ncbi:hydrolase [Clostridium sporogenes]|nr:hydrolase [Clostridium sporogenes]MBW5457332.1 hydrolase [Clostridium sporogenes]
MKNKRGFDMNKKNIGIILLVISIFAISSSNVKATESNMEGKQKYTIEEKQVIEKNNKEMKELINNWDKIKEATPEEFIKIEKEKKSKFKPNNVRSFSAGENTNRTQEEYLRDYEDFLGGYGDILITPIGKYDSFTGHAGIVCVDNQYTIEAYPMGKQVEGVQRRVNNWKDRYDKVILAGVNGADESHYRNAIKYAEEKIGLGYNYNILNKWTTNRFYCSQIVWRAWMEQGFDLDKDGGSAVLPNDLISDKLQILKTSK